MRKFTLFIVSLFMAFTAMAQTPVLKINNPDVSAGPVELTAEQVAAIRSCNGVVTVVADVTITSSSANSVVFGAITDYTSANTGTSNIIGLGTGGNGYRIHAGTNGGHYWTKDNNNAQTPVSTSTKRLFYVVNGSHVTVYAENGKNTYVNINLETSNIFSDNYAGENTKFYIGGIVHNSESVYAPFSGAGTISSISFYDGAYTPIQIYQAEALAIVEGVEGKIGYPTNDVIENYKSAVNEATDLAGIETAKQELYNSEEINTPVNGGTYTFTFVHKDGVEAYINCTGSALTIVKREADTDLPYTAMFRTYIDESGKYYVKTYNDKFVRYTRTDSGIANDTTKYTRVTFPKILDDNNFVAVDNNKELFGMLYIRLDHRQDNGDKPGALISKKTSAGVLSFDWTEKPYFQLNNTNYFTSAIRVEKVDVPMFGNYYRLQGSSDNYVDASSIYNNATATTGQMSMKSDENCNMAGSIFYFNEDNRFLNYATGTNVGNTREILNVGEAGNPWAFFPSSEANKYKVVNTNVQYYLHDNSGNRADRCDRDIQDHSATHSWRVEKVASLPVTITDAGYATFHAPVEVTVPDGVTANTVTINGNWAILNEIEGKVIPANTPVILKGAADTYNLAITTTGAAAIEGNALSGTVAAEYATIEKDVFVLANVEGNVGLYKAATATSFTLKGHAAYLALDKADPANNSVGYRFGFDGTTAVEKVEMRNEKEAIYDLQGRRIDEITEPGIYIVNGVKVLVK